MNMARGVILGGFRNLEIQLTQGKDKREYIGVCEWMVRGEKNKTSLS